MKTHLLALMTVFQLIVSAGCGSSLENEALKRAKEAYKLTQLGGS
jgi:cellobiose-specific phosphotransferase system component IIA